ncbi:MAG: cytochrome c [Pyrinomonadaceae bacterium]
MKRQVLLSIALLSAGTLAACEREERGFRVQAPDANRVQTVRLSPLQPGVASPTPVMTNEYENNAFALTQGKQLYQQMNCVGCHANGGGAIGPPLMDAKWIYGSHPDQVFATIVQGRPNGMPSFGGKLADYQIWQLAAYVRSLSGNVPKDAAPGRNDNMQMKEPENSKDRETPKDSTIPKSAEGPS